MHDLSPTYPPPSWEVGSQAAHREGLLVSCPQGKGDSEGKRGLPWL